MAAPGTTTSVRVPELPHQLTADSVGNIPYDKIVVHPLVLLSVVDHFNRMGKTGNVKRVVGILLGKQRGRILDVSNSFAVPFDEDDKDRSVWFLDHDYLENMYNMFKKVNAREKIVGWYHTGPKLNHNDIAVNELLKKYNPNSVLVIMDAQPRDVDALGLGLPTQGYYSVEEVHDDGTPTSKTFEHLASEIDADEAEEVGVEHLLRDIRNTTVGTLGQRVSGQLSGLHGLFKTLTDIQGYLERVATGRLPVNHQIVYMLQDVFNLLPSIESPDFIHSFNLKNNDQMLVIYLAALIRSVIALHNLINNKIENRNNEDSEKSKKKDEKDKETVKEDKKDNPNVKTKEEEKKKK